MPRPCRCAGVSVWKTHATVEAVVGDGGAGLGVELEAGPAGTTTVPLEFPRFPDT